MDYRIKMAKYMDIIHINNISRSTNIISKHYFFLIFSQLISNPKVVWILVFLKINSKIISNSNSISKDILILIISNHILILIISRNAYNNV